MMWKREKIASNAVGYGGSGFWRAFFVFGVFDPNFRLIVTKPDNVPIVGLIFLLVFFVWYSMREGGAERSAHRGRAGPDREGRIGSRLGVARPGLHRAHLADPLLGRPDRLVDLPEGAARAAGEPGQHAEPVEGAVVLPRAAGNAGLLRSVAGRRRAAEPDHRRADRIPYIDKNPKGNGYYTFNERKAEITIFLFGFVVLWCSLIVLGTFLRGPNWNFFGPFEFWDIHKLEALTNVNLSEYIWVRALGTGLPANWFVREFFGILLVLFYVFVLPVVLAKRCVQERTTRSSGRPRYYVDGVPVPDDDVAAAQDARAMDLQPEVHRRDS